jgi:uncharacterized protein YjbJ (UPF0337 family)
MTQDQWHGRLDIVIGAIKECAGAALRYPTLRQDGRQQRALGHARASYGQAVAGVVRRSH